ncbi:MAG: hypothetical protein ABSB31_00150 [Dehalococcoidia bacterium]|jgi:hypothetical protein
MVKYTLFLSLLLILTISSGCQTGEGTIKASLNNEFSLAIGQTAGIQEEQLIIKFDGIQEDSRCPRGATCIWQGRVSCVLQVSDGNDSTKIVLTQPGLSSQYGEGTYNKYDFTSHVQPYPELGKKISSEDYRVLLTIKKISSGANQ